MSFQVTEEWLMTPNMLCYGKRPYDLMLKQSQKDCARHGAQFGFGIAGNTPKDMELYKSNGSANFHNNMNHPRVHMSKERRKKIKSMYAADKTVTQIAVELSVSKKLVWADLCRMRKEGEIA